MKTNLFAKIGVSPWLSPRLRWGPMRVERTSPPLSTALTSWSRRCLVDQSYCLDASLDPGKEYREVYIFKCHGRYNQRWAFTDGADGSSAIIGLAGPPVSTSVAAKAKTTRWSSFGAATTEPTSGSASPRQGGSKRSSPANA